MQIVPRYTEDDTKQHAIWYDEKALLKEIEARIKQPVAPLGKDLALPAELVESLGGRVVTLTLPGVRFCCHTKKTRGLGFSV